MSWTKPTTVVPEDALDIYTPAEPGTLKRAHICAESGLFRLSRRDSAVYSIEIHSGGAWGRCMLFDGRGNRIFYQPSSFTGSFPLNDACARDGLFLWNDCGVGDSDAQISVMWREMDAELV